MGTWGTSISSNDTFEDVYDAFFILYNSDWKIELIIKKLKEDFQETLEIDEDSNNFWFALAKSLWECNALDETIFNKVKEIIQNGIDLKVWKELDASEQDLKKRKIILDKFLNQISVPKEKAKARKKIRLKYINPIYSKGDCLVFKMENGNYGGAIIFEAEYDTEYGYNYIASTSINQIEKPNLLDFENAYILTIWENLNYGKINQQLKDEQLILYWFEAKEYKNYADKFEKIGNIKINKVFSRISNGGFKTWIPWDVLIFFAEQTFQRVENGQKQNKIIEIKNWKE